LFPKKTAHSRGDDAVTKNIPFPGGTSEGASQNVVKVLLISPFAEDHQHLQEILQHSKWQQYAAHTQSEALAFLRNNPTPVAICESELPDGTWKDLLSQLAQMQHPPTLVVTSRLADEVLWSEALNLGAYNVLAKPLDMREVFHVVSFAWLNWKSQCEPRQHHRATAAMPAACYA
jgi:DNA-binding response OmpR family regulator